MPKLEMTHDAFTCPHCGARNEINTSAEIDVAKLPCSRCGLRVSEAVTTGQ